jgi:RNA polymerase sigma-70 factor, ECF subfamily
MIPALETDQRINLEMAVERFYQPLYRFAYGLTRNNEAEALDLTQQTFLRLVQHGHQLRAPDKLQSWLFTTLRRAFLRSARHRRRRPEVAFRVGEHERAAQEAAGLAVSGGEEAAAPRALDARAILEALAQVEPTYRAALQLYYLAELSYREIARALGIPLGTVMSRLARGKDQLRAKLNHLPA